MRPSPPAAGRSYLNAANGIFVGYDTLGEHLIRGCSLYRNRQNGILRGSSDPKRMVLEGNHEFENRGLPPDMTALLAAGKQKAARKPSMAAKNPKLAEEGGLDQEFRTMRSTLEELDSTIPERQHQKYLKRC